MAETVLYTLGHSHRSLEEFLALLREIGVRTVVDVRRFPGSRRWPWFQKDRLQAALESAGFRYVWLGETLGGYARPPYPEYMSTPAFREGLKRLENLAREGPTAILCAEKDWRKCHRRFIAQALTARGWEVVHVLDFGVRERHPRELPLDVEGPGRPNRRGPS